MASHGAYQRTGYGAQGGDVDGGFLGNSQQQNSSQGGGASGKGQDDSLRPVSIKQLLDCTESYPGVDLAVDGVTVTQVTIVGQIRSVSPHETNITYRIDDGTGLIDVKKWVDPDQAQAEDQDSRLVPDKYVRVFGRLRSMNNKKHIGAHMLRPVDDYNEVSYHLLEVAYVHLYLTKGPPNGQGPAGAGTGAAPRGADGGDSMFVDDPLAAAKAKVSGASRHAQAVYSAVQRAPDASGTGLNLHELANQTRLSSRDILAAAEELLQIGLVYTTVDDETWAILDT